MEIKKKQAQKATNGRPTKLQQVKITDFGKCRLAKRLAPPPHLFEDRKLKN